MSETTHQGRPNFIKFIGTAGARFVTISQLRSSGGTWISFEGTNVLIDPGPGSLVKCLESVPTLDPATLDAVIVTHKHLDHCNDLNIMIEAMTHGGSKKRGTVFVPGDMLGGDSILLNYAKALPEEIITLKEGNEYVIGNIKFSTPLKHTHTVETYGLRFTFKNKTVSFIVDTKYPENIAQYYQADTIVINTVFVEPLSHVDHLSIRDAGRIISALQPQKAVLTHFGRDVINQGPESFAKKLTAECGIEVIAATDGMTLAL